MRRLMWSLILMCSMLALSACNTVRGLGQDIEKAGSAISNAANK